LPDGLYADVGAEQFTDPGYDTYREWVRKFDPSVLSAEEPLAIGCERHPFPLGKLAQIWPHLTQPVGRVHFAGAAYDNLPCARMQRRGRQGG